MIKCLFFLLLLLFCLPLTGATIYVSSYGDGSPSSNNVQSAYNAAVAEDIIQLPTGTNYWGAGVILSKPVSVFGAGTNSTRLVASNSLTTSFFTITGFTNASLCRFSGICFDMVSITNGARFALNFVVPLDLSSVRVDHNWFLHGYQQITSYGIKGVIDHNTFQNPLKGIDFSAGDRWQADASWASMSAGTGDALFVEDNWFIYDANYLGAAFQESIGTENGGKIVVRYNRWDSTNAPISAPVTPVLTHGNAGVGTATGYWQNEPYSRRGQSVVEVYNNIAGGLRFDRWTFRGSANLVWSNTVTTAMFASGFYLREEEYSAGTGWVPARTNWPAEDQVHNTFIWGNSFNGSVGVSDLVTGDSVLAIVQDRDYFLHAPQSSGGYEYFTSANGASGSYPTDGTNLPTAGTMVFSASGANAFYPYTPYIYPHPLVTSASSVSFSGRVQLSGRIGQ